MRTFNNVIFLGNGEYSEAEIKRLRERLESGLCILGGLQQPHMSTDPPVTVGERLAREAQEQKLYDVARDIVMALTGKNITFMAKED